MPNLSNSTSPTRPVAPPTSSTTAQARQPTSTSTSTQNSLIPQQSDPPRLRQAFPLPMSPGPYGPNSFIDDVKDTQLVSPAYETSNGGGNYSHHQYLTPSTHPYRPRSPVLSSRDPYNYEDPTLSRFLQHIFVTAKTALNGGSRPSQANSFLTPSSSEISLPYLSSLLPPSTSPSPSPISTSSSGSSNNGGLFSVALRLPSKGTLGFVTLCGMWYMTSALSSNTGKVILTRFRYPVTLTFVQFAFVAGYCVLFLALREQLKMFMSSAQGSPNGSGYNAHAGKDSLLTQRRTSLGTTEGWGIKKPSKHIFHGTLMMSLFQIAGHVFSSMAIARVPVSTVHTIKALSPLFTVVSYVVLFRVRYSSATYIALGPLTLGVMLACSFDFRANAVGFLCALGSTVIFVSQNIFSKKLLPKENPPSTLSGGLGMPNGLNSAGGVGSSPAIGGGPSGGGKQLDKLNLLFYSSGMAFFLMIPIWLYTDGPALLSVYLNGEVPLHSSSYVPSPQASTAQLVMSFLVNGSVHFAQNLLAFSILARTSPVTYSIASLVKRIAVICLAIIWSGQHVTLTQGLGMTLTFVGLWMYNRAKGDVDKGEKKRANVEKREMFLPSQAEELRHHQVGIQHLQSQLSPPPPPPNTSVTHQQQFYPSNPTVAVRHHHYTSPTRPPATPPAPPPGAPALVAIPVAEQQAVAAAPLAGIASGAGAGGVTSRKGSNGPPQVGFGNEGGAVTAHR